MRIFYSFLIILTSAILIMLPLTEGVYDFRTDQKTDVFTVSTPVGSTNTTVQLTTPLYGNDTSTFVLASTVLADAPLFYSYNSTSRATVLIGLTENTTRSLDVAYDVDALGASTALNNLLDRLAWIWILIWVAFPMAGLAAIWLGRAE